MRNRLRLEWETWPLGPGERFTLKLHEQLEFSGYWRSSDFRNANQLKGMETMEAHYTVKLRISQPDGTSAGAVFFAGWLTSTPKGIRAEVEDRLAVQLTRINAVLDILVLR